MTTMPYVLLPDAVQLLHDALAADTRITAVVADRKGTVRIGTMSPQDTSLPWIRLHRIGGPRSATAPMRLAVASVQVDCFAPPTSPNSGQWSGDEGAMALALLAEATLFAAPNFSNETGVICKVAESQGPQSLPDTSRTPPTPRVLLTVAVTVRPNDAA